MSDLNKDLSKKFINYLDRKQYKRLQFEADMLGEIEDQHPLIMFYYASSIYLNEASKNKDLLNAEDYLEDVFHQSYKNQLEFYAYLLNKMGFEVDETGYFVVCNADRSKENFEKVMSFDELLVPYKLDTSWIEKKLDLMIKVLNNKKEAESHESCMNCAYQRERSRIEQ